jgi:thioredoxin 1
MGVLREITENDFEQVVTRAKSLVLVEFGAVWCAPCKMLEPVLIQIGSQFEDKVSLVKVDVDESLQIAMRYQVMSVPTLILFNRGEPVERWSGYQSKDRILSRLTPHLT